MTKTMIIEGMMCPHCEARVKKVVEKIPGVESAVASHTEGTVVITMTEEVDLAVIKEAIEDQDYKVIG